MLAKIHDGVAEGVEPVNGGYLVNDVLYPAVIDQLWTDAELKDIGLYRVKSSSVPDGHAVIGVHLAVIDGDVVQVFDTVAIPEPVPVSITPLQARKGLRATGLKPMVDAFVSTLPEEDQEEWEYALEIRRDSPIIAASISLLPTPLTEEQVDELFRQWSKL